MNLYDDLPEQRRDSGMAQVQANNEKWPAKIIALIRDLPIGWTGIGESVRILAEERGIDLPKHPNAWGSVIGLAVREQLLAETGRRIKMTKLKSNARKSPEYVRVEAGLFR